MDKSALVQKLCEINNEYCQGETQSMNSDTFFHIWETALNISIEELLRRNAIKHDFIQQNDFNKDFKFLTLCFHLLDLINIELNKSDDEILSVQETRNVRNGMKNIEEVGILNNIQPNLPYSKQLKSTLSTTENVLCSYNLLKYTIDTLVDYIKMPNLRMLVVPHCLQSILIGLYQISFCPLKKPSSDNSGQFVMSQEMFDKFTNDQQKYRNLLESLRTKIHPTIYVRETMAVFQNNSAIWFKRSLAATLTNIMRCEKGVEEISQALFDGHEDDTTKIWKIIDVLTKLIMNCQKLPDFRNNICLQVVNLLAVDNCSVYERLVIACAKSLYWNDDQLCKTVFLTRIMAPLLDFAYKEKIFRDCSDLTDDIKQSVRLINGIFIDNSVHLMACVPIKHLDNIINVTFHFYHLTLDQSTFKTLNNELKAVLITYINSSSQDEIMQLFDRLFFAINSQLRADITIEITNNRILVTPSKHRNLYTVLETPNVLLNILQADKKFALFNYLTRCVNNKEKYFPSSENLKESSFFKDDMLQNLVEKSQVVEQVMESDEHPMFVKMLHLYNIFELLSTDQDFIKYTQDNPNRSRDLLQEVVNSGRHKTEDTELLTNLITLLNLIENIIQSGKLHNAESLLNLLKTVCEECPNSEVKNMCERLRKELQRGGLKEPKIEEIKLSELDKALLDITDPLLPVRGHSLLTITKLLEKKDKEAVDNKYKLLTLFQISLKDEDTFVYLNAIGGLAAMADLFPDTILEVLCEEFINFNDNKKNENNIETRMKVGEVLVRVVRLMGEMAPKYKSLLLNTFLCGVRDEDHLIRASSLANLGEVCKVLGYKLGTILSEVLVCIHGIIATDKAVEARRAAVTVIRQLFAGLESEIIHVLKDDILHIYRTLKHIYYNDQDDVMKLQAQLALEELNENVKNFMFPQPKLHMDKKVFLLD